MTRRSYLTLAQIADMSVPELSAEWARPYGAPTPNISPDLLRLGLAYKFQEQRQGALSRSTRTLLVRRPAKRPFREAKLRMDGKREGERYDDDLITLLAEAMQVQRLVLQSPELSLSQLGKREGRCRAHLGRLLRLSWLSPQIVEAIANGNQPKSMTRSKLLSVSLPLEWDAQERMLGMAA